MRNSHSEHLRRLCRAAILYVAPLIGGCQTLPPTPNPPVFEAAAGHVPIDGTAVSTTIEARSVNVPEEVTPASYEGEEKLPAPLPKPDGDPGAPGVSEGEELPEGPHGLLLRGDAGIARELNKGLMAAYVIEPPDILLIEATPSLPGYQRITGEYLVRPDGTVGLGMFGSVRVAGLTIDEAHEKIEDHLAKVVKNPKVFVDVSSYNSKVYYVIADGAGFGQQVNRVSWTGNETVLDGISQVGGLPTVASKKHIWVARPIPGESGAFAILDVDWKGISQCGMSDTNYQLWPGDRIFVQSDRLLAFDGCLSKIIAPMERIFGVTLLGATTVKQLQNMGRVKGAAAIIVP